MLFSFFLPRFVSGCLIKDKAQNEIGRESGNNSEGFHAGPMAGPLNGPFFVLFCACQHPSQNIVKCSQMEKSEAIFFPFFFFDSIIQ